MNPAWARFAATNGGEPTITERWGIGANYLDAVPAALRPFYQRLFATVPDDGSALHPVSHAYECSSPEVFRKFNMQVFALPHRAGFVVVNSLVTEARHPGSLAGSALAPLDARYRTPDGITVQCAHCRRVRRADGDAHWEWVPAWVAHSPSSASHGLCPECERYYYPLEW